MKRLLVMLVHNQGLPLNQSQLARSLAVATTTVQRYLDILSAALLIRVVRPYLPNLRKRLTRAPKVYVRDSGFVHGLLRLGTYEELLSHPIVGQSWEGYVGEQIRCALGAEVELLHYRSARQEEIDYVCEHPRLGLLAFEIERSNAPTLSKAFWTAVEDVKPTKTYVVSPNVGRHPLGKEVEGIGVRELIEDLRTRRAEEAS